MLLTFSCGKNDDAELVYVVYFKTDSDSKIAPVRVVGGNTIEMPASPIKKGCIFSGWFTTSTLTQEFNFLSPIVADLSLQAKWEPNLMPNNREELILLIYSGVVLDLINTSKIKEMNQLFLFTNSFNGSISNWDVSNVTDMSSMLYGIEDFNQDISGWDVSNVTNMSYMFQWSNSFNQDIGKWDVSSVTNMAGMFFSATNFNQDIGNWDVSKVKVMHSMFFEAKSFNQDIGGWDVSNVTQMGFMFSEAKSFNQDIGGWDVSNVTQMGSMYLEATSFNQDISSWDVTEVQNMTKMFKGAENFNQPAIKTWDIQNNTEMSEILLGTSMPTTFRFDSRPNFNPFE